MDPMRVPLAASMAAGRDGTFEQVLGATAATAETPQRVDPRQIGADRTAESTDAVADAGAANEPDAAPLPVEPTDAAAPAERTDGSANPTAGAVDVTDAARAAPAERPQPAAGAADEPRAPRSAEPLLAAALHAGGNRAAAPVAAAAAAAPGAANAVGGVRAADAATRGTDAFAARTSAPLRAPAAVATHRTLPAPSAELLEQARDSVFKQILMKLAGDGGEMRLRLEPPDLGELDLRLVVQGGNRLDLTIAAERPELAQLLQRHLDALKTSLEQAGLEVTHASVQTRSEFARDQARREQRHEHGAHPGADDDARTTIDPRRRGYVSATGLDFWA